MLLQPESLFPPSNLLHKRFSRLLERKLISRQKKVLRFILHTQGWQLTVARWLDFSDNLLYVPPAHRQPCNLVPGMTNRRDVSWGELKSLPTYCTHVSMSWYESVVCLYSHTPQCCGEGPCSAIQINCSRLISVLNQRGHQVNEGVLAHIVRDSAL